MIKIDYIKLQNLVVNPENDRHGTVPDESSAIAWLCNNKEIHMKNLAADIVSEGEIYEPPLVYKRNGKFMVADGNRRVTSMKLIKSPDKAPNQKLRGYYEAMHEKWIGEVPSLILCRIEDDIDRIDAILYRRHNGSQNGVGQSPWDDRMKRNFVNRTGKSKGLSIADKVETLLSDDNRLPIDQKIPRSTLNRLLSSELFLNRVGLSKRKSEIVFTHDKKEVLSTLQRIAHDLASHKVVLGDLWDSRRKNNYLDELALENILPKTALKEIENSKLNDERNSHKRVRPRPLKKPYIRNTLIPHDSDTPEWGSKTQRQRHIWDELQFRLNFKQHPNAIAVLLRVLLELSVKHYVESAQLSTVQKNDKLSKKILKVAGALHSEKLISADYFSDLNKMSQRENLVSTDTLNRYVHSKDFSPSTSHLKPIWDSLDEFIILCLNVK